MIPNPFPWVEVIDPKPEPTFTIDQILEKMVEVFGDKLANPEQYPAIARYQFKTAEHLCRLNAVGTVTTHLTGNLTQPTQG